MYRIDHLECEFSTRPLGIGTTRPRLSWQVQHEGSGRGVADYQVLVASSPGILDQDRGDLWDTGRTEVGVNPLVEYDGAELISRQRCWWKVRVWDDQDRPGAFSDVHWFELALLDPADWEAQWVGFPTGAAGAAIYLRQPFELDQEVTKARLYTTGLGWFEAHLNGQKIGHQVLDPAPTDVSRHVLYATFDVTDLLRVGVNVLGGIVGNGWQASPKFLAQLEIELADGTTVKVCTGRNGIGLRMWNAYTGPITRNSIYDGEDYDARLHREGWNDGPIDIDPAPMRDLQAALTVDPPGGVLTPQVLEPIEVVETRKPVAVVEPQPGVYVFDVGQNLAGWARLTVNGPAGACVRLRFAESVYEDGSVNQENLRAALATDTYILRGEGKEGWEPRFTYHGFRYVQVENLPSPPGDDTIQIQVVRSALDRAGAFESDHDLVNKISDAVYWTEASNVHGVPTDCPQRNERMGWLNDMAARSEELVHTFDVSRFGPKWLVDVADAQDESGAITDTAPFRFGTRPADPVSVCFALIPWLLYQHYGDLRTADEQFANIRRWYDYLESRSEGGILSYSYYGDWAPPVEQGEAGSRGNSAIAAHTPGPLISTAHFYRTGELLGRLARALGRDEEAARLEARCREIAAAFDQEFWDEASGGYGSNNQASNSAALYFHLVPEERIASVMDNLIKDVRAHDTHLTTGNLCTKYILEVLCDHGQADLAFELVTQTTYPSWGYMIDNGATTIWERWEHETGGGMNSHNHPMYGSVGAWFYRYLAGIQLPVESVGFSHVVISPVLPTGLNRVRASLETVRGTIESAWARTDAGIEIRVTIPSGVSADVHLPGSKGDADVVQVGAGNHQWVTTPDDVP